MLYLPFFIVAMTNSLQRGTSIVNFVAALYPGFSPGQGQPNAAASLPNLGVVYKNTHQPMVLEDGADDIFGIFLAWMSTPDQ